MFSTSTLSANWLFRFMSPVLLQEQVVDRILQALEEEESKTIMMPSCVSPLPLSTATKADETAFLVTAATST